MVAGILLGYLIGNLNIAQVGGWRTMYGASFFPALVLGAGMVSIEASQRKMQEGWNHTCSLKTSLAPVNLAFQCISREINNVYPTMCEYHTKEELCTPGTMTFLLFLIRCSSVPLELLMNGCLSQLYVPYASRPGGHPA